MHLTVLAYCKLLPTYQQLEWTSAIIIYLVKLFNSCPSHISEIQSGQIVFKFISDSKMLVSYHWATVQQSSKIFQESKNILQAFTNKLVFSTYFKWETLMNCCPIFQLRHLSLSLKDHIEVWETITNYSTNFSFMKRMVKWMWFREVALIKYSLSAEEEQRLSMAEGLLMPFSLVSCPVLTFSFTWEAAFSV